MRNDVNDKMTEFPEHLRKDILSFPHNVDSLNKNYARDKWHYKNDIGADMYKVQLSRAHGMKKLASLRPKVQRARKSMDSYTKRVDKW